MPVREAQDSTIHVIVPRVLRKSLETIAVREDRTLSAEVRRALGAHVRGQNNSDQSAQD
jgi:hypothetical protein